METNNTNGFRSRIQLPMLAIVFVASVVISIATQVMQGSSFMERVIIPPFLSGDSAPLEEEDPLFQRVEAESKNIVVSETPEIQETPKVQETSKVQETPESQETSKVQETQESQGSSEQKEAKKPLNIVILYGDDWRHDSIGSANASIVRTPFFDWLASQGMKFIHNCVTTSVCWISRATLYTGLYVSRHQSDYPDKPLWYSGWNETWPHLLRSMGYHLGHVGKWHFPVEDPVTSTFHHLDVYYGDHWYDEEGGRIHSTKKDENGAIKFLKERPKEKPFLLEVCFFAPHSVDGTDEQYFPQDESMSLYENETVAVPVSATEEAWSKLPWFFEDINEGRRRWRIRFDTPEKHQQMMKNYFRLISEIDKTSEAIYRELEAQNILEDTMIIFTTDNGLFHSEHQLAGKWFPHQESIRVPLIIKDPRMPRSKVGSINDDFTLNIDLASTILGAAGIKQPNVMQGRDISDLYLKSDDTQKWREEFFYEHPVHLETRVIPASTALVRKKYKFMTWPDYNLEQLFDLEEDPFELNDIINATEMQEIVAEMRMRHDKLKQLALQAGSIDENAQNIE